MKIVLYRDNYLTALTRQCLGTFFPTAFCTQQLPLKLGHLHRKCGGTDAAWGAHGQLYQRLLLCILSHGVAVDDTKINVKVGPLKNAWLDDVLLPRDAKTVFRLARSFQLRGLCQLCKAQQGWCKPFSTLRSQVYWRSLMVFILSTNVPDQHFILLCDLVTLAGNAVVLELSIGLLVTYSSGYRI